MPIIMHDLRRITSVLQRCKHSGPASATAILAFNKIRSTIEHRLLPSPSQREDHVGSSLDGLVDESCRLATLVYVNIVLRELHYSFSLLKVLKRNLMCEHELYDQHVPPAAPVADASSRRLLLWSLCVGAVLALDESEEDWFALRIANAVAGMAWREVEECLGRVLWVERMSEVLRRGVWRRVEEYLGCSSR
ncbi:MAG: hypothetical protein LQ347_004853 [Umbilicaria vellea]|nr:MAG: hypothetical protein LQ347_004853 [Umbilicaria vellea]